MSTRCPTCGSTVEVHHGLEGTSHYRPVKDERLEAAGAEIERHARKAAGYMAAMNRTAGERDALLGSGAQGPLADALAELEVAEARARTAEEALEAIHKEASGSTEADRLEMNGQLFRVLKIARAALATRDGA